MLVVFKGIRFVIGIFYCSYAALRFVEYFSFILIGNLYKIWCNRVYYTKFCGTTIILCIIVFGKPLFIIGVAVSRFVYYIRDACNKYPSQQPWCYNKYDI